MKAIILARVSSKEQEDNNSIPAQVRRLKEYAQRVNLTVIEICQLVESSTKSNRAKFSEIIHQIKHSKQITALVTDTIDRLQRDFRESVQLDELIKAGKLELHFVRENLVINQRSNSADILRWDMGVIFAKSYVTQLSDNVKRSQEEKIKNGEWLSKAPFGYTNIRLDNRAWIEPDKNASIVALMFRNYASGTYSIRTLRTWLVNEYGINKSISQINNILKNPFYYGKMKIKDMLYPHKYKTIISSSLYNSAQQIMVGTSKTTGKHAGHTFLYKNMLACGTCGCRITPEAHKGHVYYRCTQSKGSHGAKYTREEAITCQIENAIRNVQPTEQQCNEILSALKKAYDDQESMKSSTRKYLTAELAQMESRIDRIFDAYIDGDISKEEHRAKRSECNAQKEKLEHKLASVDTASNEWYNTAIAVMELVRDAPLIFKQSSEVKQKQHLLKVLFLNLELNNGSLLYKYNKPFDSMANFGNASCLAGETGLEPATPGFGDPCSTN